MPPPSELAPSAAARRDAGARDVRAADRLLRLPRPGVRAAVRFPAEISAEMLVPGTIWHGILEGVTHPNIGGPKSDHKSNFTYRL